MPYESWRGTVGLVKPTMRPGSLEEEIRLMPDGVGVLPIQLDVRRGTQDEFESAIAAFEAAATRLAEAGAEMIHLAGTPPFMLLGREAERRLLDDWTERFGVPVFAAPMADAAALRALGELVVVRAGQGARAAEHRDRRTDVGQMLGRVDEL